MTPTRPSDVWRSFRPEASDGVRRDGEANGTRLGVGVATWQMFYEGKPFSFQYPLLTQVVEISLDKKSMALDVRPRATDTRMELDAFVTCGVIGAAEVENVAREHLAKHIDRPVTPFDPAAIPIS
ncbi:hypothetical protein [Nitrosospira sp. NRS527]|uniref:hypothetical protein n=1 Tax=Nitrosospira sp. NRS527 TaxID=155925 RepID=UPI001AF206B4|nr:hypothetical protein [Nitrosospira sp. NRS527]BCT67385.1 hypothetical protein NNRS527_00967 [Nitrosospira sp. NRS527]